MSSEKKIDLKKIGIISGTVMMVVAIAVYAMTTRNEALKTDSSSVSSRASTIGKPTDTLDPEYRKLALMYNKEESDKALNSGKSFVGMDLNNKIIPPEEEKIGPYSWDKKQEMKQSSQGQIQGTNGETEFEKKRLERFNQILTQVEASRKPAQNISLATALDSGVENGDGKENQWVSSLFGDHASEKQKAAESKSNASSQALIKALSVYPAVVDTATNSDSQSMKLLAHIASGKYQGAKLFSTNMALQGDGIEVKFTTMEWHGDFYNIEAYAVEAESREFAIASEVNDRWFRRILLPAIASGIGQTGQLYKDSNSRLIITNSGNEYRTTGTPNSKAIAGTMIGGIGEQAGRAMAEDARKVPVKQVKINKGKVIGVQFTKPVTEADKVGK